MSTQAIRAQRHRFAAERGREPLRSQRPTVTRHRPGLLCVLIALSALLSSNESLADGRSVFLAEPTEYTDVLDAFDGADDFDFRLTLGFETLTEGATVQRESRVAGAAEPQLLDFAKTTRTAKRMWMSAEFGLFPDLMLFVKAPFVLEDARTFAPTAWALQSGLLQPNDDGSYDSRVRDGVPYVDAGLAYGPLNQFRSSGLPTWVVRLSAQVATGEPMVPCLLGQSCFRGAGRGTVRLVADTRMSYRFRLVEPYAGGFYALEAVTTGADYYFPGGDLDHDLDRQPPRQFGFTLGAALIPWEARGRMQRIVIDARLSAVHSSRGRDYSALFDVLGVSPALSEPNVGYSGHSGPRAVRFTGLTTVDAHARLRGDLMLRVQAAQYVRFRVGVGLYAVTGHLLTGAYPCADSAAAGSCSQAPRNPSYFAPIDRPGQRLRLANTVGLELSASASAQF